MNQGSNARLRFLNNMGVFHAASTGNAKRLRALLQSNPKLVHSRSPADGATPLLAAVQYGEVETFLCCIQYGADVEATNRAGLNALQLACMRGDRRRYQRICQGQAPESRDGHSADGTCHPSLAAEPLGLTSAPQNGAHHARSSSNGRFHTPTPPAQAGGSGMTLLVLRHCGLLDLNARDPAGWCALHHAVQARNGGAVRALLAAGADFRVRQGGEEGRRGEGGGVEEGATPLQLARAVRAVACATILESAEAAYTLRKARTIYEDEVRRAFLPINLSEQEYKNAASAYAPYLRRDVNNGPLPSLSWQTQSIAISKEGEAGVEEIGSEETGCPVHAAVSAFVVCELNADLFNEMGQYLYGSV